LVSMRLHSRTEKYGARLKKSLFQFFILYKNA
jgi:hypothetical protein